MKHDFDMSILNENLLIQVIVVIVTIDRWFLTLWPHFEEQDEQGQSLKVLYFLKESDKRYTDRSRPKREENV